MRIEIAVVLAGTFGLTAYTALLELIEAVLLGLAGRRVALNPRRSPFDLIDLGLNLAVALPIAYALLTACWRLARPLGHVFIILGQRSLGAFVLHVYGILLVAHLRPDGGLLFNTMVQVTMVTAIAGLLNASQRWPQRSAPTASRQPRLVSAMQ